MISQASQPVVQISDIESTDRSRGSKKDVKEKEAKRGGTISPPSQLLSPIATSSNILKGSSNMPDYVRLDIPELSQLEIEELTVAEVTFREERADTSGGSQYSARSHR